MTWEENQKELSARIEERRKRESCPDCGVAMEFMCGHCLQCPCGRYLGPRLLQGESASSFIAKVDQSRERVRKYKESQA